MRDLRVNPYEWPLPLGCPLDTLAPLRGTMPRELPDSRFSTLKARQAQANDEDLGTEIWAIFAECAADEGKSC